MPFQKQVAEREEAPQTLRHLLAFTQQEAGMKPKLRERLAGIGFGLRDFVFVMREDEIFAARVQVESLSEFSHRHDGALQGPARTPRPNRRIPRGFPWFRRLPHREIACAV